MTYRRPTYTEIKKSLDHTWREHPESMRVLAARYYVGAETRDSLRDQATLTDSQAEYIIDMR